MVYRINENGSEARRKDGGENEISDRDRESSRVHGTALPSSSPSPTRSLNKTRVNGSSPPDYLSTRVLRDAFQSAPRALIQILITGTQIFGKALYAAGTQAVKSILSLTPSETM